MIKMQQTKKLNINNNYHSPSGNPSIIKDISGNNDEYSAVLLNSIVSIENALGFDSIKNDKGELLKDKSFEDFHKGYVEFLRNLPSYKLKSNLKNTTNCMAKITLVSNILRYNQLIKFNVFDLAASKDLLRRFDKLRFYIPTPSGKNGRQQHRSDMLNYEKFIASALISSDNSTHNINDMLSYRLSRLVCVFILSYDYVSAGSLSSILVEQAILKQHLNRKEA